MGRTFALFIALLVSPAQAQTAPQSGYDKLVEALMVRENMLIGAAAGANIGGTLNPNIPADLREEIRSVGTVWVDEYSKSMKARWPAARAIYIEALKSKLGDSEATELAQFFSTPLGHKFILTQQGLARDTTAALTPWLRETGCLAVAPARARMTREVPTVRAVKMSTDMMNAVWTQFGCATSTAKPF
jgi:Uncharacterized protein conserved in bacteria (DUF2059)